MNLVRNRCIVSTVIARWIFIWIVFVNNILGKSVTQEKYTLCAIGDYNALRYCPSLNSDKNSEVKCIYGMDRMDCLNLVLSGEADFSVFNVEDLLVATKFRNEDNLVITNEIRRFHEQPFKYDMVALVASDKQIKSLSDIEGLRLCHPGFEDDDPIFGQYFEWKAVPQKCVANKTILENRISSLHKNFGPSCKAGTWSLDPKTDKMLKQRYPELCEMCQSPFECSRNDLYWGRRGPLNCLTDCRGDIAWVRLQDANQHFATSADETSSPCHDFVYLCPNGTTQSLSTTDPCVWLSNPWPFVATRREVSNNIRSLLKQLAINKEFNSWEGALSILLSNTYQPLYELNPPLMASQYLHNMPELMEAISLHEKNVRDCSDATLDRKIDICVVDEDELKKCELMSYVGDTFDVNPQFSCVLSKNCMRDVADGKADILSIGTEYLLDIDSEKLTPILYQTSYTDIFTRHVSAVVRSNSNIYTIEHLPGKKACFVNTYGLGWNSFIMMLRNSSFLLPEDQYPYELSVSKLFSDVCVIDNSRSTLIKSCFPDTFPDEFVYRTVEENETLALMSIINGGAHVTFLNFDYIDRYLGSAELHGLMLKKDEFRQITPYKFSLFKSDQYLMWSAYGQILASKNTSSSRRDEIVTAMLSMSALFGFKNTYEQEVGKIFNLFGMFDYKIDVLFPDAAKLFITVDRFDRMCTGKRSNYEINLKTIISSRSKNRPSFDKNYSANILPSCAVIIYALSLSYFLLS